MIAAIGDHIWQSTLFALGAWLLAAGLRQHRARVRHAVWLAGLLKFLVPFSALVWLGAHIEWRSAPGPAVPAGFTAVMDPFTQTVPVSAIPAPGAPSVAHRSVAWPAIVLAIWALGAVAISASWLVRWRRIRAVVRGGSAVDLEVPLRAITSPTRIEPGVFGILRPVLMLPEGIFEHLSPPQWKTVIEHELCHVRHRDNFFAAVQMSIETTFWFHPLVWWIGRQMIAERERACDEAVLGSGAERRIYAEAILNVCRLYVESPLPCVSGVTGAELKDRVRAILSRHPAAELSTAKKAALSGAAIAALLIPVAIGMLQAPPARAQSSESAKSVPKWEVASIRPCDNNADGGRKGGRGPTPGRLSVNCSTVMRLIESAYGFYSSGHGANMNHIAFEGAPAWLNSERYTIEAKGESPQGQAMMRGPMMQALLEERFKLKIRREIREVPVYNLTVAKGGPKNLQPWKQGSCVPFDFDHPPAPRPVGPEDKFELCAMVGRRVISEGEREFIDLGVTMAAFAEGISPLLDRNVIDRTGIPGTFDIHIQVSLPDPPSRDTATQQQREDDERDLIFAAVQKLGLKLESAKGPGEFFVIEHIERPSNDFDPVPRPKP